RPGIRIDESLGHFNACVQGFGWVWEVHRHSPFEKPSMTRCRNASLRTRDAAALRLAHHAPDRELRFHDHPGTLRPAYRRRHPWPVSIDTPLCHPRAPGAIRAAVEPDEIDYAQLGRSVPEPVRRSVQHMQALE